eukprot:gene29536-10828_t
MLRAVGAVTGKWAKGEGTRRGAVPTERAFVWVDFGSIAQQHRGMQMLSKVCGSGLSDFYMLDAADGDLAQITAEMLDAADGDLAQITAEMLDAADGDLAQITAEMLDAADADGDLAQITAEMLDAADGDLAQITAEMLDRVNLSVFEGEFSCCAIKHKGSSVCDREALMPAVLGLFSMVLSMSRGRGAKGGIAEVDRSVPRCWSTERFFPERFLFESNDGWEEDRELFGPMVALMEKHM